VERTESSGAVTSGHVAHTWQVRLAWLLCAVTAVLGAIYTWLAIAHPSMQNLLIGWPVVTVSTMFAAVLGARIVGRYPGHRVGWLFILGAVANAANGPLLVYADLVLVKHELGPEWAAKAAVWIISFTDLPLPVLLTCLLFLLFPDGRLLSPRWRPVLWATWASFLVFLATMLVLVDLTRIRQLTFASYAGRLASEILDVLLITYAAEMVLSTIAVGVRMRRARGVERQQMRWLAVAAGAFAIALGALLLDDLLGYADDVSIWFLLPPVNITYSLIPVAAALAVLRYRLYDIDVLIGKAITWGLLVVFVATGYVIVVVTFGAAIGSRAASAFWPSLIATAIVAIAFQPLRRRFQQVADRVVYGKRAAPYDALADFSRRLVVSKSPKDLLAEVAEAVAQAVGARQVTLQLQVAGATQPAAAWPADATSPPEIELPLQEGGEVLGSIAITMPPGRWLRPGERRLLVDFTEQAQMAFRNARMEAELAGQVAEVRRRTEQLSASRRRLLSARDDERRRLAIALDRRVLPHLRTVAERLETVPSQGDGANGALALPEQCAVETESALDELREISRGLFPTLLERRGLAPALSAHFAKQGLVTLTIEPSADRRFDSAVEAATYLFCIEAANAVAGSADITLAVQSEHVEITVEGTELTGTEDIQLAADRIAAIGGEASVITRRDGSPALRARIPLPRVSASRCGREPEALT
jgi:hypothetical protein